MGRIVEDGGGQHERSGGRAAAKDLACVHPIAALYFRRLSGSAEPVGASRRHENEILGRNALEESVDWGLLAAPTPGERRDEMGVHLKRERRRAAMGAHRTNHAC